MSRLSQFLAHQLHSIPDSVPGAKVARAHGIKTFSLIVLPENQQMLGLLRKMGWIHQAKLVGGVYEITFDVPAES